MPDGLVIERTKFWKAMPLHETAGPHWNDISSSGPSTRHWPPNDSGLSSLSTRIRHCWDAHHVWRQLMPHATPPRTRLPQTQRASSASALPLPPARACEQKKAAVPQRTAARDGSASQNGDSLRRHRKSQLCGGKQLRTDRKRIQGACEHNRRNITQWKTEPLTAQAFSLLSPPPAMHCWCRFIRIAASLAKLSAIIGRTYLRSLP
jgi:hypothetical protein